MLKYFKYVLQQSKCDCLTRNINRNKKLHGKIVKKGCVLYMKVSLIVAMDKNRVIGKVNDIPWRIPNN